ncbi:MAG: hypothetical protein WDZ75_00020 [Candidatus Paceibacterota bacterium]
MVKNAIIGLLLTLLVVALFLIVQDIRGNEVSVQEQSVHREVEDREEGSSENETGAIQEDASEETATLLIGVWQSLDDPQSTLIFHRNGEITDSYGGGVVEEKGNYQLFSSSANFEIAAVQNPNSMILRQSFGTEEYYYEIIEISEDLLEIVFLTGDGSVLRYERLSY